MTVFVELSPPKPLDQSKNVTVRTFHIWPGSVHGHIFLAKSCQKVPKKPKFAFPYKYSLEAIEWSWTINNEVDAAKSATRFGKKSPKCQNSATRCGKMSPKGFKGVSKGPKGFQTVPRVPRGSKGKVLPDVAKNAKGVLRESATRCGKKSPKGFQKSSKVVQLYLVRRTGSNACLRCWPEGPAPQARRRRLAQGPKGPELVTY